MSGLIRKSWIWALLVSGSIAGSAVGAPWSDLILGLVVLPAMVLTISSARSLSGSRGWTLLTIGSVIIGFAPVVNEVHRALVTEIGPLTIGDAVLVLGYGLFISGLRAVLRARTMAVQSRAILDASLATLWVGFLTMAWAGPQLAERLTGYPLLASLLYLPLSLAIVFLLLQLILGSQSRSGSVWLLAATASLVVVSELNFLAVAAGQDGLRRVGVGAATLAIVGLSAAIRHPSAAELETPIAGQQEPLTVLRSLYLVGSFVAIGGSLIILPRPSAYLAVILAAIGVMTCAGLYFTTKERERLILVERELRHSVTEITRAPNPAQIAELGGAAVDRLLSDKKQLEADFVRGAGGSWITFPDAGPARLGTAEEHAAIRHALAENEILREEKESHFPGTTFLTRLAIPFVEGREHIDLLVVEASPVLTTTEIEQLEQIVGAVQHALVAHELEEASHQRRSDQRFRALVQDSGDVVSLVDPESLEIKMVSPSMQRILGHAEEAFVGRRATTYVHDDDRHSLEHILRTTIVKPQESATDVRLQHVDGHYNWFSVMVRDHTTDDEVGGLVMNLTDIQDRKMAELSLGFSEQRYRELVLNSKDVFAVLESDLTINYISPNIKGMLGFSAADLVASKISSVLSDGSALTLDDFLANTHHKLKREVVELELRTQGGENRTAEVTFSDRTEGAQLGFMLTISDITERRRLEQSLRDHALYDSLTGLANRATLHFELQQLLQRLETDQFIGLLNIDINDFKAINESVGFETGDEILVQVATRLRSALRATDVLARIGGNEFAIAVKGNSRDEVLAFARRALETFEKPFDVAGRLHRLNVSIGVDITDDRSSVARDLMDQAFLALGAARKETQESVRVFVPMMRTDATERFELAADLEGAIDRDEMHVVYQPIVEMATRNVRGVEALLRWTHPHRGPVSPAVFIPLAERSGLVIEMGRWVLEQSCSQLKIWRQNIEGARALGMSVNVSALQLELAGEAERLGQIVLDSGVDTARITIELTESTLIEDSTWIRAQLQTLRGLGMRVAVDDFGTGAAGLSHLRDVPFNTIKIDKSYVDALSQSAEAKRLVSGVIDLAHTLGAETVAEGIEEPAEFDLLHSLGCDLGQGFYLGRPMDPDQLEDWFAKGRTGAAPALISKKS